MQRNEGGSSGKIERYRVKVRVKELRMEGGMERVLTRGIEG